jgi:acyl-CoA thioesterase
MKGIDKFAQLLGINLLEVKDGYAKVTMKIVKEHINGLGMTNGGVIFSLADYAFAEACNYGDNVAVAVQTSINFLKPTFEGDMLIAEASRISGGRTTGLYNVTVYKGEKIIAVFSGLCFKQNSQL